MKTFSAKIKKGALLFHNSFLNSCLEAKKLVFLFPEMFPVIAIFISILEKDFF